MGKLIPILLAVIGLGGGVGAGLALRPEPEEPVALEHPCGDVADDAKESAEDGEGTKDETEGAEDGEEEASDYDYVKLNNQFIVPVVVDGRVEALVVMSITVEVPTGQGAAVYEREPRLRDAFLQVMFDHANAGGFSGAFTSSGQMNVLRAALKEVAQKVAGPMINDVLILDIVRQDA